MNYEELKPWQICQLVHNQVVCDGKFDVTFENHGCQWRGRDGALSGEVFEFTINEAKAKVRNYTSDINFAWPIIMKHGITIEFDDNANFQNAYICNEEGYPEFEYGFDTDDCNDNPLLAAMICFLKMKDAEK